MVVRYAHEKGFTLIEALIVVVILAAVASVAVPTFSSAEAKYLDRAANDLVQAIRFARSEAIRTGTAHGIYLDANDTRLRVYIYNGTEEYSVYHPVDRLRFQIDFESTANPVVIAAKSIKFLDLSLNNQSNISFAGGSGVPGSSSVGFNKVLEYADFVLQYGVHQLTVSLSSMSGRVTVH